MVGRKPKPTVLHIVENTVNATRHSHRANEPVPEGRPVRPKWLKGRAAKIWDEYIVIGHWLTAAETPKFAVWCELTAETEGGVKHMENPRIAQWRALGSELGFDPASRTRLGGKSKETKKDPAEKYFSKPA